MNLNKDYIEVFDVYTNDYKLVEKPKENNNYNKFVRSRNNYSLFLVLICSLIKHKSIL